MVQWYMGEITKHHQVVKVVLFDRFWATLDEIHSLQKINNRPRSHIRLRMRKQKPHPQSLSQTVRMRISMRARAPRPSRLIVYMISCTLFFDVAGKSLMGVSCPCWLTKMTSTNESLFSRNSVNITPFSSWLIIFAHLSLFY